MITRCTLYFAHVGGVTMHCIVTGAKDAKSFQGSFNFRNVDGGMAIRLFIIYNIVLFYYLLLLYFILVVDSLFNYFRDSFIIWYVHVLDFVSVCFASSFILVITSSAFNSGETQFSTIRNLFYLNFVRKINSKLKCHDFVQ